MAPKDQVSSSTMPNSVDKPGAPSQDSLSDSAINRINNFHNARSSVRPYVLNERFSLWRLKTSSLFDYFGLADDERCLILACVFYGTNLTGVHKIVASYHDTINDRRRLRDISTSEQFFDALDDEINFEMKNGKAEILLEKRQQNPSESASVYFYILEDLCSLAYEKNSLAHREKVLIEKFVAGLSDPRIVYEGGRFVVTHPDATSEMVLSYVQKMVNNVSKFDRIMREREDKRREMTGSISSKASADLKRMPCPLHPKAKHRLLECSEIKREMEYRNRRYSESSSVEKFPLQITNDSFD